VKLERRHLATAKRSVVREMPLPERSSINLAKHFVSNEPSPDQRIQQQELARRVRGAVASLSEADREIFMLRNFEQLSNMEAAQLLDLNPETTKKRYARALVKLQTMLSAESDDGRQS